MNKKNYFVLFFCLLTIQVSSRPIVIINHTNVPIHIIIWKNGSLIHDHIMKVNSSFTLDDWENGVLVQWKYIGVKGDYKCTTPGVKLNSYGYYEVLVNQEWADKNKPILAWYLSSLTFDYQFDLPKA